MDKINEMVSEIKLDIDNIEKSFTEESQKIVSALSTKHALLKAVREEVSRLIFDINTRLANAQSELEKTNNLLSERKKEYFGLEKISKDKRDALEKEIQDKTEASAILDNKLVSLRKIVDSYMAEKEDINNSLTNSRVVMDMVESKLIEAKKELEVATKETEKQRALLGDYSSQNMFLNRDIAAKTTEIASKRAEADVLEKEIDRLKAIKK